MDFEKDSLCSFLGFLPRKNKSIIIAQISGYLQKKNKIKKITSLCWLLAENPMQYLKNCKELLVLEAMYCMIIIIFLPFFGGSGEK